VVQNYQGAGMSEKNEKIKAVGLLSGGLDSTLAVKLMIDQGIGSACPEIHIAFLQLQFCRQMPCKSRRGEIQYTSQDHGEGR